MNSPDAWNKGTVIQQLFRNFLLFLENYHDCTEKNTLKLGKNVI